MKAQFGGERYKNAVTAITEYSLLDISVTVNPKWHSASVRWQCVMLMSRRLAWCSSWGRSRSWCRSGTAPTPASPWEGSSSPHCLGPGCPQRAQRRTGAPPDAFLQRKNLYVESICRSSFLGDAKVKSHLVPTVIIYTDRYLAHLCTPHEPHMTGCVCDLNN